MVTEDACHLLCCIYTGQCKHLAEPANTQALLPLLPQAKGHTLADDWMGLSLHLPQSATATATAIPQLC